MRVSNTFTDYNIEDKSEVKECQTKWKVGNIKNFYNSDCNGSIISDSNTWPLFEQTTPTDDDHI